MLLHLVGIVSRQNRRMRPPRMKLDRHVEVLSAREYRPKLFEVEKFAVRQSVYHRAREAQADAAL